jgi:hypothetical protein
VTDPSVYSHHRPYVRQSDINTLPYMGPPETALRVAFRKSYSGSASRFRSEKFTSDLAACQQSGDHEANMLWLLDAYVSGANGDFHDALVQILTPVAATGAAMAQNQALTATIQMVKESQPQRRRRRVTYPLPRPKGQRLWIPNYPSDMHLSPTIPTPSTTPRQRRRQQVTAGLPTALNPRRGLSSPYHLASADNLPLHLVVRINNQQRAAIRSAISDTLRHGWKPDKTAMVIANVVGLDPRWQRAVQNAHARWLSNGVPERIANQRAQDYADELREKRGIRIARTELLRALNYGRLDGWRQQASAGLFSATDSVKEWVASPFACPECAELGDWYGDHHGFYTQGIDGMFPTQWGGITAPPAHPHCRCTTILHPNGVSEKMSKSWSVDESLLYPPDLHQLLLVGACAP